MKDIINLICDTHNGVTVPKFENLQKDQKEQAIRKAIFDILGVDNFNSKEYRKAIRKHKAEMFEIIEEVVDRVVIDGDEVRNAFFEQFAEVKNLALGDTNEFYVEGENTLALSKFSGSHFDIGRKRVDAGSSFQVEMADYGIKIFEYWDRFLAGRIDLAKLIMLAQEAINRGVSESVYATFSDVLTKLPSSFIFNGAYDETRILTTIAHVEADNGSEAPLLVGTKVAISKLQNRVPVEMSEEMKNQKNTLGYVEYWNGYRCVVLPQVHKKGTFDFVFEDSKILILPASAKPVKVCFEGEAQVKDINDGSQNADKTIEQTITLKFGTAIVFGNLIGTIEITG